MRPVDRGAAPRTYSDFADALPDLRARIGDYCSYCERQIETHLAVEHIQPKSRREGLKREWTNFLLGCVNCNSCKGKKHVVLKKHVWPDTDNTLRAFSYRRGGIVEVAPRLRSANRARALATIKLVGLDKVPGNPDRKRRPSSKDLRWERRREAWLQAEATKQLLAANDTPEARELVTQVATGRGEFSIWWTVFHGDADMLQRLRNAFSGTATGCFHGTTGKPVRRCGGYI